ncbi:MAG: HAD-IA family hydrolase [Lactobacillaceae bacterium]|jgi:putative hydrolase of the HAD superfamily|nr:HAD-IA family hydrolase [Lactobacillaceae bacterium]
MKNVKTLVFDLDDTLYPKSLGYQKHADEKIAVFLQEKMGMSFDEYKEECNKLREKGCSTYSLYKEKGTTFEEYLICGCEHDMSKVEYNEELHKILASLPYKKIIYTDANRKHVDDTLKYLRLESIFKDIYTVIDAGYIWKSFNGGFESFLKHYNLIPEETIIFEDNLKNLKKAKTLGLHTVLISEEDVLKPEFCDFLFKDINSALNFIFKK